jgi:tRNA A-37 threonylcarbamoyl transferase component Bud32
MSIKQDILALQKLSRAQIEKKGKLSGKKGKEGTTIIVKGKSGREYAIKLFKTKKSSDKILKEANFQERAAEAGVAPKVYAVNTKGKYIIMQKMSETIVDYARRKNLKELKKRHQAQLYALCKRLDEAGLVQNDGNPLNLMLDDNQRLYLIDYGFAMNIDKKVLKKRGSQPNINLTLWDFCSKLKHYRIGAPLCKAIADQYVSELKQGKSDYKDKKLLKKGNEELDTASMADSDVSDSASDSDVSDSASDSDVSDSASESDSSESESESEDDDVSEGDDVSEDDDNMKSRIKKRAKRFTKAIQQPKKTRPAKGNARSIRRPVNVNIPKRRPGKVVTLRKPARAVKKPQRLKKASECDSLISELKQIATQLKKHKCERANLLIAVIEDMTR